MEFAISNKINEIKLSNIRHKYTHTHTADDCGKKNKVHSKCAESCLWFRGIKVNYIHGWKWMAYVRCLLFLKNLFNLHQSRNQKYKFIVYSLLMGASSSISTINSNPSYQSNGNTTLFFFNFNRLQIFTSFYFTYSLLWSLMKGERGGGGGAVNCAIYSCICFMICLCFLVCYLTYLERIFLININSAFLILLNSAYQKRISLVVLGDTMKW